MNKLKATITHIESQEHLSLVQVKTQQIDLQVLLTDTPQSVNYLTLGNEIEILFKETEVILSKTPLHQEIALNNHLPCTIQHVELGKILSKIHLNFGDQSLQAILTTNICQKLQFQTGQAIVAMVKANEIMCAL